VGRVLLEYCANVIKTLESQFDACSVLTHGTSLGSVREQLIRDFLVSHLPSIVRIISGQIFDSHDARSTQQDVVLALKTVPRLPFASGIDLIFAEGVVATIEVKSALSAVALKQVGSGIASVRSLKTVVWGTASMGGSHQWPSSKILSGIITFKGSSFQAFDTTLQQMTEDEKPDFILDLSKGVMIRNHGFLIPMESDGRQYVEINSAASGFMMFLTFLTEITGTISARGVNWRAYCK
jgi:hypothetical protein